MEVRTEAVDRCHVKKAIHMFVDNQLIAKSGL